MFFAVKKNSLILIGLGTLMVIAAICIMIFGLNDDPAVTTNAEVSGKVIVIDAGHGGVDGGASASGILEKDINLAVALKLRDVINSDGNTAVLTRDSDEVKLLNNTSGKYVKKDDLLYRLSLIEDSGADLFISIHMNKFENPKYSGAQVFYSQNSEDSKKLGELIQASLINNLDNNNNRVAKKKETGIYILKNAKVPAALVECGFLSNPEELKNLTDEEYQKKLAEAIYTGICEYFK